MYEVFERKYQRLGNPRLSFTKIGQIAFNQVAAGVLQKAAIEHVLLLWDSEENKLAIKSTSNKKDARAYRLRFADRGNGAAFACKTFVDYAGIDISERRAISVEINPNREMFIEVVLPPTFFKKRGQPQPRIVGKTG